MLASPTSGAATSPPGPRAFPACEADRRLLQASGLLTEASPDWAPDDIRRYADHVIDSFGPDRVMWASNWPVLNLVSTYEAWDALANEMVDTADRDLIFGGTAAAFYRLSSAHRTHRPKSGNDAR